MIMIGKVPETRESNTLKERDSPGTRKRTSSGFSRNGQNGLGEEPRNVLADLVIPGAELRLLAVPPAAWQRLALTGLFLTARLSRWGF